MIGEDDLSDFVNDSKFGDDGCNCGFNGGERCGDEVEVGVDCASLRFGNEIAADCDEGGGGGGGSGGCMDMNALEAREEWEEGVIDRCEVGSENGGGGGGSGSDTFDFRRG